MMMIVLVGATAVVGAVAASLLLLAVGLAQGVLS
jgi:hypothetical protein